MAPRQKIKARVHATMRFPKDGRSVAIASRYEKGRAREEGWVRGIRMASTSRTYTGRRRMMMGSKQAKLLPVNCYSVFRSSDLSAPPFAPLRDHG